MKNFPCPDPLIFLRIVLVLCAVVFVPAGSRCAMAFPLSIAFPQVFLAKDDAAAQKKEDSLSGLRPYRDIRVVLYMTDWCPYCREAKEFLASKGVTLIEYNIDRDKGRKEEMVKKSGGSKLIPFMDIEGITVRGYLPDEIMEAIEKRRRQGN